MRRYFLALFLLTVAFASSASAETVRDMWPQATAAADSGDFAAADKKLNEVVDTGKQLGVRRFPLFAQSAIGLARHAHREKNNELRAWAMKAAQRLDAGSASVAFSLADLHRMQGNWGGAFRALFTGFSNVFTDYVSRTLAQSDMVVAVATALAALIALFALLMLLRYSRPAAHDFREILGTRTSAGTATVLAYALLIAPLFLWLGPVWLVLYWLVLFFGYATKVEKAVIIILLLIASVIPIALDWAAHRIAGVGSPVVRAAAGSTQRAYNPETLRRMRELVELVPDDPNLRLLLGNLYVQEGDETQASLHYRRAVELNDRIAGVHLNIGNLHFFNNDFIAATTEYETAAEINSRMAIAYYNQSVANGEQYKFDMQGAKLAEAKKYDRALVERTIANPPVQKVLMYNPPMADAWALADRVAKNPASRGVFGNYAHFDVASSATNLVTIGSLLAIFVAIALFLKRRKPGFAGACIKCGRTFCHKCKSSRESAIYCTQCIHIYLKRDGVSIDTKRAKLQEVQEYQGSRLKQRKLLATFFPGSGQILESGTVKGLIALLLFSLAISVGVLIGRLGPVGFPAETMRMFVWIVAGVIALVIWFIFTLPVFRERFNG